MKAHKNHDTVEFNQVTPEELEEARLKIVDDRSQSEGRILVMRSKLAGLNTTGERIIKVRAGTIMSQAAVASARVSVLDARSPVAAVSHHAQRPDARGQPDEGRGQRQSEPCRKDRRRHGRRFVRKRMLKEILGRNDVRTARGHFAVPAKTGDLHRHQRSRRARHQSCD